MVRRALTRQTRWYQNRCSTIKIKDFIVEKPFWKILEFWPLVTSILTWAKKWPKWFRNDFSRAFAVFRFVLRCAGAEIDGGVFKHPPPPAGRGKSRGPAGRGLSGGSFSLTGHSHAPTKSVDPQTSTGRAKSQLLGRQLRLVEKSLWYFCTIVACHFWTVAHT